MLKQTTNCLRKLVSHRTFHTTATKKIDAKTVEEVKIPVPWGHISGKWWGSKDVQPILAIHGWQDNAGSFDPLANVLPDKYSLLAIDVPGNGFSSHIPPFQVYYFADSIPFLRYIKQHFGFDKLHLLGHSGGSLSCFLYAAVYPEDVSSYFGIDYIGYAYGDAGKRADVVAKLIDKKISLGLRDPRKSKRYTWDEAKTTWVTATQGSVNSESAEILMKRGVEKTADGKFIFTRDHRLKSADLYVLNDAQMYKFTENVNCDVSIIKATDSKIFDSGLKYAPQVLEILKNSAKSFEMHILKGKHHLHMDIPNDIADLYSKFRTKIAL